ncbi:DUF4145 domain-containing protein [Lactiplantibacillus nangangensis]|uniref:DUF4145 domain-containing protein n=1 Tax=Lactiplantibacillus nangangensis TaxID=2559917 RepID=A0ABW1SM03_9LACO|nr:DUF4145 domain-containing protein [Lactiplantibacillus nangangensis]
MSIFTYKQLSHSIETGSGKIADGRFNCPFCQTKNAAYSAFLHAELDSDDSNSEIRVLIRVTCSLCSKESIYICDITAYPYIPDSPTDELIDYDWDNSSLVDSLIYPQETDSNIPSPNTDMPANVLKTYTEASMVLKDSPRASAALSRLAIQQLVDCLVDNDHNLNQKIGDLVAEGLPIKIKEMLDSVRVIGNNAVHPGVIDFDNVENATSLATTLLTMVNLIVQYEITNAKALEETYNLLTDGQKKGIQDRDSH